MKSSEKENPKLRESLGRFFVGTCGWQYQEFKGVFYPANLREREMLSFYSSQLKSTEVNNSFYRLPAKAVFEHWRAQTPEDFVFSVKGSRYLTHLKKLQDPKEPVDLFLNHAEGLGHKLGPILFQLPPKWRMDFVRLRAFLNVLPKAHRFAIEFRDPSWLTPAVYDLLREHQVAFCIYDWEGFLAPRVVSADFTYVRLHGPGQKYRGSYHGRQMEFWGKQVMKWLAHGLDVYVYFDNTASGDAIKDALALQNLVTSLRFKTAA